MNCPGSLIADAILAAHFAFLVFILGGEACVIIGYYRDWRWVRNLIFRVSHISAIGFVVALAWTNRICPLTVWENEFRNAAGGQAYPGTFVGYWLSRLVYYDAPQWLFPVLYSLFGALVFASWLLVRPGKAGSRKPTECGL